VTSVAAAKGVKPGKPRRTQDERSATTRALLLDATIDCLFDLGWAGTTTTEIAERAGVSRGAQLHHFPTKKELVATAVERLLERRLEEFRHGFATLPEEVDRAKAVVDLLWSMFSGPVFYAWLELLLASRTDPSLRKTCEEINRRFGEGARRAFREVWPPPPGQEAAYDIAPKFALTLMQGLALEKVAGESEERIRTMLRVLKNLARAAIPPAQ
jgi:AcrR family transcriptional regulator